MCVLPIIVPRTLVIVVVTCVLLCFPLLQAVDPPTGCPKKKFTPKWPAACPYVTAVGGTNGFGKTYETAWGSSSGGFSNRYGAPSWQAKATAKYLANKTFPAKVLKFVNNTKGQ